MAEQHQLVAASLLLFFLLLIHNVASPIPLKMSEQFVKRIDTARRVFLLRFFFFICWPARAAKVPPLSPPIVFLASGSLLAASFLDYSPWKRKNSSSDSIQSTPPMYQPHTRPFILYVLYKEKYFRFNKIFNKILFKHIFFFFCCGCCWGVATVSYV
jgi:hypothetical protein